MNRRILLIFLSILFQLINHTFGQDSPYIFVYPTAHEVDIQLNSITINMDNKFVYTYKLTSLLSSKQDIWTLRIIYQNVQIDSIIAPPGWFAMKSRGKNFITWGANDTLNFIKPGNTLDGYKMYALGIPNIQNYYVQGYIPCPIVESEPDQVIGGSFYENSKKGKIIAPGSPPDPFIVNDFVDTLISYKHQAFELGWIDNQGILNSLDAKLDNIKKQLERDQTTTAINGLKAFVNEVEAQKDKHLTSEAYGLLRYNVEYLIKKLSEE